MKNIAGQIVYSGKHKQRSKQQGAVAVAFILSVVLLLGFVGFVVDISRLFVSKSELQNAADSCALAAASALTGANPNQLVQAVAFGRTVGGRNKYGFQKTAVGISEDNITFSESLEDPFSTQVDVPEGDDLKMRFVRCAVTESDISTLLVHIINLIPGQTVATSTTIDASATASLQPSVTNCAIPLAVCQASLKDVDKGEWIQGRFDPGKGINGAYKWVQFPGSATVKELAEMLHGSGQCALNNNSQVSSKPGVNQTLIKAWNTRFGVYHPGGKKVSEAHPDFTGWVYTPDLWPAQSTAFGNFMTRRASTPKHPPSSDFNLKGAYRWASTGEFEDFGRDRRVVVSPIVDCSGLAGNGTVVVKDWACLLMLNPVFETDDTMYLEYLGLATELDSACATVGAPGGTVGPLVPTLVQ